MKRHRFVINETLRPGSLTVGEQGIVRQMARVLRLRPGDEVELADGRGSQALATVVEVRPQQIVLQVADPEMLMDDSTRRVTLYASVLKRENFEWVVQKATEIGVARIVPLITARTVKRGVKIDRLRLIAKEASEQCGRADVPEITEPTRFDDAIASALGLQAFLHTEPGLKHLDALESLGTLSGVWTGPEGGWSPEEISDALGAGFVCVTLGRSILRAETAAIIASYLAVQKT